MQQLYRCTAKRELFSSLSQSNHEIMCEISYLIVVLTVREC